MNTVTQAPRTESFLKLGNQAMRQGNQDEAIRCYLSAIESTPALGKMISANLTLARKKGVATVPLGRPDNDSRAKSPPPINVARSYGFTERDDVFDREYYIASNSDVKESGMAPESHYFSAGEREGRQPNAYFDPIFYSRLNADVRNAGVSPFSHFKQAGKKEGRLGQTPLTQRARVSMRSAKPLLFVGHDGILAGSEIVLLEVIRWFFKHTVRRLKVLLLAPGPVADRYSEFADIYVLPENNVDNPVDLKAFLTEDFEFIYLNTVVSGRIFQIAADHSIALNSSIITHIHEMEKVLDVFPNELKALQAHTRHWISASPASTETLVGKHGLARDSVTTVPAFINPIARQGDTFSDLKAKARRELGLHPKSFVVAGCGTIYWRKGCDIFIETARRLKDYVATPIEFVWIGNGPDREALESTLTTNERTFIRFVGIRTNANELLAAADVFFLSSREDPFPLVVLESAQHGIPTVCFAPSTGITAFIEEDAGIALPETSAELAMIAIRKLLEDPTHCRQLGDTACRKLFRQYTADKQNLKVFDTIRKHTGYRPSVSVIVPFFNHESFVEERLNSIFRQSIKDIEIIAIDDCSADNTVARIKHYLSDSRLSLLENATNSGSPFKQWEKGIALASSTIVWIAEGDDTCDDNFLSTLLPYFDDSMVNIASARTEVIDDRGEVKPAALVPYLDKAYSGKFSKSYVLDGFVEVNQQLGAMCTLVNASGILIRKSSLKSAFKQAQNFKMCGDWLIYLECLKDGKIAYDVSTTNYFRRHMASQVHKIEGTETYFEEREAITQYVVDNFIITQRILRRCFSELDHEWARFKYKNPNSALESFYDKAALRSSAKFVKHNYHVAFYVHGMLFSLGGIERLAAQLANYLVENGWQVTIYCRIHSNIKPIYALYNSVKVVPIFDENRLEPTVRALNQALCHDEVDIFVPMLSEWLFEPIVEAAQNTGVIVLVSEHNDPWKIEELWWTHESRLKCFEKVDGIHFLLDKYTASVPITLQKRVVTIPNGVHIPQRVDVAGREKIILSVGRLAPQKRFDRLISSIGHVREILRETGHHVEIYGDGALREELQDQINRLQISDLVFLKGNTDQIESLYRRADFFVLPSDFEGLPLTLLEALSYGLPSIGFFDCNGPNEIIQHNKNGLLVKDENELKNAILHFLKTDLVAMRLSALERSKNYSIQNTLISWHNTLIRTINEK